MIDNGEQKMKLALFSLGQVVATSGALEEMARAEVVFMTLLRRHVTGDWGDLCGDDINANRDALVVGARLFSVYILPTGVRVWVITEADRSATTFLLPEEY